MKSLFVISFICLFSQLAFSIDQRPDILIVGDDTILLKSFPLEELGFKGRPFSYGKYDFPGEDCFRGYQAVWEVIGNKLFLTDLIKVDDPQTKIDIVQYFQQNDYIPIVINGNIFADWFTKDLTSFPRDFKYFGCVWKPRIKKPRPSMRFDHGVMTLNRYKMKGRPA